MPSPEYVDIPIRLSAEEVDVSKLDVGKLDARLSKKLAGLKKTVGGIFKQTKGADLNTALTSSLRALTNEYNRVLKAQERYDAAVKKAAVSNPKYKAAMRDYQKQVDDIRESFLGITRNGVGAINPNTGRPIETGMTNKIREQLNQAAEEAIAKIPKPRPEDFAPTEEALQRVAGAAKNVANEYGRMNTAGQDFNATVDKNRMSDSFNAAQTQIQQYEKLLDQLNEKTKKMEALDDGRNRWKEQWKSAQYDAELYKKKIEELKQKLQEMVDTGEAFRFGPGRGERVTTRNALNNSDIGVMGQSTAQEILSRTRMALNPEPVDTYTTAWQRLKAAIVAIIPSLSRTGSAGSKTTSTLSKGFKKLSKYVLQFGFGFRTMYYAIRRLRTVFIQSLKEMARESAELNAEMSDFMESVNRLKGEFGAAFQPLIQKLLPYLTAAVDKLADMFEHLSKINAAISGQSYYFKAVSDEIDDINKGLKESNKQLGAYDDLQVISSDEDKNVGYHMERVDIPEDEVAGLKAEFAQILTIIGFIAIALAGIKLAGLIAKAKKLGAALSISGTAVGAIALGFAGIVALTLGIEGLLDGCIDLKDILLIIVGILAVGAAIAIAIGGWIPLAIAAIVAAVTALVLVIIKYWDQISAFFKDVWNKIVTWCKTAWNKITEFFKTAGQKILTFFEFIGKTIANFFIGIANTAVKAINGLLKGLNKVGGFAGINIPLIPEIQKLDVPKLAQGAVIPPNKAFLATLGDQRSGTNIEAPLDTIKQALMEVLAETGGKNDPIVLKLDGKTVAQVVWDQNEKRYKQTGKMVYSV